MKTSSARRILELWPALSPREQAELVETAERALCVRLEQGAEMFGVAVADEKRRFERADRRKLDPRDVEW